MWSSLSFQKAAPSALEEEEGDGRESPDCPGFTSVGRGSRSEKLADVKRLLSSVSEVAVTLAFSDRTTQLRGECKVRSPCPPPPLSSPSCPLSLSLNRGDVVDVLGCSCQIMHIFVIVF